MDLSKFEQLNRISVQNLNLAIYRELSDVSLIFTDEKNNSFTIHTSKYLLAINSSVFHIMFTQNFKEKLNNVVNLPMEEYDGFCNILKILHDASQIIELTIEELYNLLVIADKYQINNRIRYVKYVFLYVGTMENIATDCAKLKEFILNHREYKNLNYVITSAIDFIGARINSDNVINIINILINDCKTELYNIREVINKYIIHVDGQNIKTLNYVAFEFLYTPSVYNHENYILELLKNWITDNNEIWIPHILVNICNNDIDEYEKIFELIKLIKDKRIKGKCYKILAKALYRDSL